MATQPQPTVRSTPTLSLGDAEGISYQMGAFFHPLQAHDLLLRLVDLCIGMCLALLNPERDSQADCASGLAGFRALPWLEKLSDLQLRDAEKYD